MKAAWVGLVHRALVRRETTRVTSPSPLKHSGNVPPVSDLQGHAKAAGCDMSELGHLHPCHHIGDDG
jgi:hypothetical protein